jgi:hypothetical protein
MWVLCVGSVCGFCVWMQRLNGQDECGCSRKTQAPDLSQQSAPTRHRSTHMKTHCARTLPQAATRGTGSSSALSQQDAPTHPHVQYVYATSHASPGCYKMHRILLCSVPTKCTHPHVQCVYATSHASPGCYKMHRILLCSVPAKHTPTSHTHTHT